MKKFKTIIMKALFVMLTILASSQAITAREGSGYPAPPPYTNPTGSEFPVLAWHVFINPELLTRENFEVAKECGINLAMMWHNNDATVKKALDAVEGTGVYYFLSVVNINDKAKLQSFVKKYNQYPIVSGYTMCDEPTTSLFTEIKTKEDNLWAINRNKLAYINIYPNYASPQNLIADSYRDYVEKYVKTVNPQMLSFDNYTFHIDKQGNLVQREGYYENLEIASEIAKEAGIPLWTFCLTTAHFNYPVPNKAQLSLQAFAGLAYGSQCIQLYGYQTENIGGELDTAPLAKDGSRRKVWYTLRDVLHEVHALSPVFLGADVVSVRHTGKNIPSGTKRLKTVDLPYPFSSIESQGSGIIVSQLTNNGKNYLLLVNRDIKKKQKVKVRKRTVVFRINRDGKKRSDTKSTITLDAGGWYLYTW